MARPLGVSNILAAGGPQDLHPANQTEIRGDIAVRGGLHLLQLATPATPTITNVGTAGAVTYGYKVVGTVNGMSTAVSAEGSTTTGNATLSTSNYNVVTWTRLVGATGYLIYRTTGGTTPPMLIATITTGDTTTYNDTDKTSGSSQTPTTVNGTGSITFGADNVQSVGSAAAQVKNFFVGTIIYVVDEVISGNIYGSGAATLGIYANAALTDAMARNLSLFVLDSTGDAWKEMFRATPDIADPWVSFLYKVGIGTLLEPQSLLEVQGPVGTGATGAGKVTLSTAELTIDAADELGRINFMAPLEASGTDAILAGASIWAVAEAEFTASVNSTSLVFATGTSAAATEKMRITSAGAVLVGASTAYGLSSELFEINKSTSGGGQCFSQWSAAAAANASQLAFQRSYHSTIGTYAAVRSGDALGYITFRGVGTNAAAFSNGAYLAVKATGTIGAAYVPGLWEFHATADGTGTDTTVLSMTTAGIDLHSIPVSNLVLGGTLLGGGQMLNNLGHVGIGGTIADAFKGIFIQESASIESGSSQGIIISNTYYATAGNTANIAVGIDSVVKLGATNNKNWTATPVGIAGVIGQVETVASSTGTITGIVAFLAYANFVDAAAVTNYYGFYCYNPAVAGAKLTNAYGIYIEAITGGATLNYAIYSAGSLNHFVGNVNTVDVYSVDGTQVVGPRVVDARCDDTIAGAGAYDDTTAGVIDALRDAMIAHGLIAAS